MTQAPSFSPLAFRLLEDLYANNEKPWYEANRAAFEAEVRGPFAALLDAVSERLAGSIVPLIGSKKTMFRQHRDTRFSKDKTPYKTNVSGLLTPTGTKSEAGGLVYLHFDATGGFVASGFHQLTTEQLGRVRQRIAEEPDRFGEMLGTLAEHDLHLDRGGALTRMPKGFTDLAEHPHADAIRLKSYITRQDLAKEAWMDGSVLDATVHHALASADLFGFVQTALER